jgi:hypothetical protein
MSAVRSMSYTAGTDLKRLLVLGVVGGAAGGMAMAMVAMLIATGYDGFWSPVRGITSVVFGDEHYGGGFSFWPVAVGVMGHMMNSMMFGVVLGLIGTAILPRLKPRTFAWLGAAYGVMLWIVMVPVLANALQSSGAFADALPHWAWLIAHLMFGVIAAGVIAVWGVDRRGS